MDDELVEYLCNNCPEFKKVSPLESSCEAEYPDDTRCPKHIIWQKITNLLEEGRS